MFDRIRSLVGLKTSSKGGGSKLAPMEEPKVKPKQVSFPGHMTGTAAQKSLLPRNDLNLANVDITSTYRFGRDTSTTLRNLVRGNPDLGGAVAAHLRMGIPEKYIPPAYNPDGSFNVDATRFCLELLNRIDKMPGWETGFSTTGSIRSVSEAMAFELVVEGALAVELVLNKARQPWYFAPVAVPLIKFYDDHSGGTKSLKPVQVVGGEEIDLDVPNFFMIWLDPSLLDAYPHSPIEAAIQPVLAGTTFLNDLRRLCERHVWPRYDLSIDAEKLARHMTEEEVLDDEKKKVFLNETFAAVQDMINNAGVEEALIHFDFLVVAFVKGQDGDVPDTFNTVKDIYDAKIATGAKSMGSILGHGTGTQNIASTETLLAMLTANGMVRLKLQEAYSKMLTLSCRLMGMDVTVSFEFDDIDLRPAMELESFKAQKQSRLKEQLSLGIIDDDEFSLRLTGRLPRPGHAPLAGTMFMDPAKTDEAGNSYSGTAVGGGQSGGGAGTQARKPATPAKKRGD